MGNSVLVINGIIFFYILQRLSELIISRSNEAWLKEHHEAVEVDPKESLQMRLFHSTWFIALILEANIEQSLQPPLVSMIISSVLSICLIVRFHSIQMLKQFWTIKVLRLKSPIIVTTGLYRYVRHPNYFIVIIELLLIPLLFKAYWTMILFSLTNLFILSRRIIKEEDSMMFHADYQTHFSGKKRFLPFIFFLFLSFLPLHAVEINVHSSTYEEAKKAQNFLKFKSTSTKMGLITTDFDGYVKDFKVTYDEKENVLVRLEVSLQVQSFDTDNNSRNEKMHEDIMDVKKYPLLKAVATGPIQLVAGDQTTSMIFTVKDKTITRPVTLNFFQKEGKWNVSGKAQVGLKEMGLPDPSIMIAKVRDLFDIEYALFLEK